MKKVILLIALSVLLYSAPGYAGGWSSKGQKAAEPTAAEVQLVAQEEQAEEAVAPSAPPQEEVFEPAEPPAEEAVLLREEVVRAAQAEAKERLAKVQEICWVETSQFNEAVAQLEQAEEDYAQADYAQARAQLAPLEARLRDVRKKMTEACEEADGKERLRVLYNTQRAREAEKAAARERAAPAEAEWQARVQWELPVGLAEPAEPPAEEAVLLREEVVRAAQAEAKERLAKVQEICWVETSQFNEAVAQLEQAEEDYAQADYAQARAQLAPLEARLRDVRKKMTEACEEADGKERLRVLYNTQRAREAEKAAARERAAPAEAEWQARVQWELPVGLAEPAEPAAPESDEANPSDF